MAKEYTWSDDDVVVDHTQKVKRIWDLIMPETYPYIKKFDTIGVKEVTHRHRMGPYHMTERKIKFKVEVELDSEPLKKIGWVKDGEITKDMLKDAYGEQYFYEMRAKMLSLLPYVGLGNFGHFDFVGDIGGSVE